MTITLPNIEVRGMAEEWQAHGMVYFAVVESQNVLDWKGLSLSSSTHLLWIESPTIRLGCLVSQPAWPWSPHNYLLWFIIIKIC